MQLYRVTDKQGDLIMDAPMLTLQCVFRMQAPAIDRCVCETRTLGAKCELVLRANRTLHSAWDVIYVERLETPIALAAERVITEHRLSLAWQEIRKLKGLDKLVCGDFHPDKELPDFCEGCTQPKANHQTTLGVLLCDE